MMVSTIEHCFPRKLSEREERRIVVHCTNFRLLRKQARLVLYDNHGFSGMSLEKYIEKGTPIIARREGVLGGSFLPRISFTSSVDMHSIANPTY